MAPKLIRALNTIICFALITQFLGCGTIMHPERRGQRGGRIDAGVAVLDAIGLLLFVIPGVIAFAVDFSTGAIYLPEKSRTSLDINNMKIVRFDSKHATDASIEYIIKKETGIDVKLWQKNIKISRISSINDVRE